MQSSCIFLTKLLMGSRKCWILVLLPPPPPPTYKHFKFEYNWTLCTAIVVRSWGTPAPKCTQRGERKTPQVPGLSSSQQGHNSKQEGHQSSWRDSKKEQRVTGMYATVDHCGYTQPLSVTCLATGGQMQLELSHGDY